MSIEQGDVPRFDLALPAVLVLGVVTRRFALDLAGIGRVSALKFRSGGFTALTGMLPATGSVARLGAEPGLAAGALQEAAATLDAGEVDDPAELAITASAGTTCPTSTGLPSRGRHRPLRLRRPSSTCPPDGQVQFSEERPAGSIGQPAGLEASQAALRQPRVSTQHAPTARSRCARRPTSWAITWPSPCSSRSTSARTRTLCSRRGARPEQPPDRGPAQQQRDDEQRHRDEPAQADPVTKDQSD